MNLIHMGDQEPNGAASPDGARRALVLHDRPLVVDLIEATLNHGLFVVRAATRYPNQEDVVRLRTLCQ